MSSGNLIGDNNLPGCFEHPKKVMCFGTFDHFHLGHLSFLKQAKKRGDYLIVVIARDQNVKKIKGRIPRESELSRLKKVKSLDFVDEAVLGELRDRLKIVKKQKPAIICLGYDQEADIRGLKQVFSGVIVRLKSYKKNIYKSSKLCQTKSSV